MLTTVATTILVQLKFPVKITKNTCVLCFDIHYNQNSIFILINNYVEFGENGVSYYFLVPAIDVNSFIHQHL